jgi:hypothetical protein
MRARTGTNLHTEFDRLRSAHDDCLAARATVSDDEYRSLIIINNFCPSSLGAFISQISDNIKINSVITKGAATSTAPSGSTVPASLDPELMISIILEEYDRRGKFTRKEPKDSNAAYVTGMSPLGWNLPSQI